MSRLINDKGIWQIQVEKADNKAICLILAEMPLSYLTVIHQNETHFTFQIEEWDYDGMERANESDYRELLNKITDCPGEDIVIATEVITRDLESQSFFDELNKPIHAMQKEFLENVGRFYNNKPTAMK